MLDNQCNIVVLWCGLFCRIIIVTHWLNVHVKRCQSIDYWLKMNHWTWQWKRKGGREGLRQRSDFCSGGTSSSWAIQAHTQTFANQLFDSHLISSPFYGSKCWDVSLTVSAPHRWTEGRVRRKKNNKTARITDMKALWEWETHEWNGGQRNTVILFFPSEFVMQVASPFWTVST